MPPPAVSGPAALAPAPSSHGTASPYRGETYQGHPTSPGSELATVPQEIRDKLTRRRKAGDEDAALDPLAQPEVRSAVLSATFEALVGFQLTDEQLRYNATR